MEEREGRTVGGATNGKRDVDVAIRQLLQLQQLRGHLNGSWWVE